MGPMSDSEAGAGPERAPEEAEALVCDFCGEAADRVRRIALDRDYDRLQTPHRVQYACDACSEEKERQRREAPGS
jgi:hypothetical protein